MISLVINSEIESGSSEKKEIKGISGFDVSEQCENRLSFGFVCVKCGLCGRKFTKTGELLILIKTVQ